jgi:hypothetical protein
VYHYGGWLFSCCRNKAIALAICLCALVATSASSLAASEELNEVKPRRILALFDGRFDTAPRRTRIHRFVELPLNYLGYQLDYHDLRSGLPPAVIGADVAAVISWFDAQPPDVAAFQAWAAKVRRAGTDPNGLKVIALGNLAVAGFSETDEARAYLARLGIENVGSDQRLGIWSRIATLDTNVIGFERDFTVAAGQEPIVAARKGDAVSHLRVMTNSAGGPATDLVVTAANGAYVSAAALVREDEWGLWRWILDPFVFFEQVLEPSLHPVPDATTLSGRRIFLATITGEGWNTPVPSDSLDEEPVLAGTVVLDHFILPYPDIPATLALVSGELDPALGGTFAEAGAAIAQSALSQPQIEAASLTRTLPLRWNFFENYRRDVELAIVDRLNRAPRMLQRGLVPEAVSTLGRAFAVDESRAYMGKSGEAPRLYMLQSFDLHGEIAGSLLEISVLAPEAAPAALMIWSGDAEMFEAALRAAREAGAEAIGGGGGVMDQTAPSLTNLWPLSVPVGEERQVYDPLSDDASFTNFWSTPSYGFFRLTETLDATENPRRLKPYHLSFGASSALQFGSRNAVLFHLERARNAEVIPVKTSHFARIARGFATTQLISLGDRRWRVENRGALQTIRFDHAVGYALDWDRSEGVLGVRQHGPSLYIALDAGHDRPIVAIKASGTPVQAGKMPRFALENSRWVIDHLKQTDCSAAFRATGYGPGDMTWHMPRAGTYKIEVFEEGGSSPAYWDNLTVSSDLTLTMTLPPIALRPVRITVSGC